MAQLYKFGGLLYKEVDEVQPSSCRGCAFQGKGCQAFHAAHPGASCTREKSVFVEHKEKSDARLKKGCPGAYNG